MYELSDEAHASASTANGYVTNILATPNNIATEAREKVKEVKAGNIGTTKVKIPVTTLAAIKFIRTSFPSFAIAIKVVV